MLEVRNGKPKVELDELSIKIARTLLSLDEMNRATILCTYMNIGSEVRTGDIVTWALSSGRKVLVPVVDKVKRQLLFSEVKDPVELEKRTFGILEPKSEYHRFVPLEKANVILVPGIAWDVRGYRLGYGQGFYDKSINALESWILKIGLAYEFQIVEKLPTSRYDRKVDMIVTERRIIKIDAF